MPGEKIQTQEGQVQVGARTSSAPQTDVAYSSPFMAKEAADKLAAESAELFRGEDWSDLPNFYCPLCNYATLDGDVAVIAHGTDRHPGVNLVEVQRTVEERPKEGEKTAEAGEEQVKNG